MTKIQDILFFRVFKPYGKIITMVFLALMLVIISTIVYYKYVLPIMDRNKIDNASNANLRNINIDVRFFSVTWCPSCKKSKPEWQKFVDKYDNKIINGFKIKCIEVDCTNSKDPIIIDTMSTFNIKHYPTVKIVKGKETIDFEGKVTSSNLENFINSISK